jgi:hypothetical protein
MFLITSNNNVNNGMEAKDDTNAKDKNPFLNKESM